MSRSEQAELLRQEYARRREENTREETRRQREIVEKLPEVAQLAAQRQEMIYSGVRGILSRKTADTALPERMREYNRRIERLLEENGYPADYLSPVFRCPICRDTGYAGEPIREECECFRRELSRRMLAEMGLREQTEQSFETFREDMLPEDVTVEPAKGQHMSQRALTGFIRDHCMRWVDSYPNQEQTTLLLMGESGLGKTFLLHAMAKRFLEKGADAVLTSAQRLQEEARKSYFGREESSYALLLAAPVLLVDDLGSEAQLSNVTQVFLYELVNERQSRRLTTAFSTNLNEEELRARYTERVASRLTDRRNSLALTLLGEDLRRR